MPIRCPDPQARHTVADFIHSPDNLMAGNDRHLVKGEIALNDVISVRQTAQTLTFTRTMTPPRPRRVHFLLSSGDSSHRFFVSRSSRA